MNAGTSTTMSTAFSAFPMPKVTLTFNGGDVLDTKRTLFQIGDNKLSFIVREVQKEDAGDYTLTLENEHGKATATIKIYVLGERRRSRSFFLMNSNRSMHGVYLINV